MVTEADATATERDAVALARYLAGASSAGGGTIPDDLLANNARQDLQVGTFGAFNPPYNDLPTSPATRVRVIGGVFGPPADGLFAADIDVTYDGRDPTRLSVQMIIPRSGASPLVDSFSNAAVASPVASGFIGVAPVSLPRFVDPRSVPSSLRAAAQSIAAAYADMAIQGQVLIYGIPSVFVGQARIELADGTDPWDISSLAAGAATAPQIEKILYEAPTEDGGDNVDITASTANGDVGVILVLNESSGSWRATKMLPGFVAGR